MKDTPIKYEIVKNAILNSGLQNLGKASIREIKRLINVIEKESDKKFIRMEMGIPGIPTPQIAIDAEKAALDNGVSSLYPDLDGLPMLKTEISRYIKNFMDVNIQPLNCIPTVGSINGAYATFMVAGRRDENKDTVLFIDPGFPVHKQLVKMVGLKHKTFDVYNYRGSKIKNKLESYLAKGNISTIIYSNPNNPSWICFKEEELQIIGELATKYDVVVAEDLAYFAMDFRSDMSKPGVAPFQPTVAKYTDNYILLISASKSFSMAGQRIAMLAVSPVLYKKNHTGLLKFYNNTNFGHCLVHGTVYSTTAGASHSAQYGLAALLKEINDGNYNFVANLKEYERRAVVLKKMFIDNGFKIVYDKDIDVPIADGFFFTISYTGYTGEQLIEELFYYGISTVSLMVTGSEKTEGLRVCISLISSDMFPELQQRLNVFKKHNAK